MNPSGFYGAVYDTAKALGATDVQANLAAAQASNETGYGASVFGNNYFGIKASSTYTGPSAYADTTEEVNGVRTPTTGNFRVYDDMTQSVADYMGMMQKNFPDAWNASTVKEAVKNLDNGVYGKYATLSSYTSDISKIANKYGPVAEANAFDASSVPTPEARPTAALNNFGDLAAASTPSYPDLSKTGLLGALFSSEPASVQPSSPVNATATGLLGTAPSLSASANVGTPLSNSGWQTMAAAGPPGGYPADPFSADRMGTPPQNDFAALSFAPPVQAPMNVTATAAQPTNPGYGAQANVPAGLLAGVPSPATPSMFSGGAIVGNLGTVSQQGLLNGTINALNASQQQALSTPMLSQAMNQSYPALAAPVDTGLLSANSPFATPAVNPAYDAAISNLAASQAQPTATGLLSQPNMSPSTLGTVAQYGPLNYAANALNAANQQAISTPMLQQAMSPSYPSLSQPVDTGALSANSPFATPAIDPSVNAAVNNVASSYSVAAPTTDRFATTPSTFDASRFGVPDVNAAMNQSIANSVAATPAMPSLSSIASTTTPTTTGLLSGYQETPSPTPGENAISGILSQPSQPSSFDMSRFAPTIDPATNTQSFYDSNWTNPAAVASYNAMSNLDTSSIATPTDLGTSTPGYNSLVAATFPDSVTTTSSVTPSSTTGATVPGPATTPATTQQAISSGNLGVGTTAAPSRFGGLINKGTIIGGLLGSAVAGPVGGILGGLLGNKVNQGGLAGLLGNSSPMSVNNIGGGLMNVASVYGGAPTGTQANTNNGGTVTSLGGGWSAYTNPFGVTSVTGPNNINAAYFGPSLTNHTNNSGPSGSPTGVGGAAY